MSLETQSLKPDKIILNIPVWSKRFNVSYIVPSDILHYVNFVEEDFGPATKLIPTLFLEAHPDTLIITVDDEYSYHEYLIEDQVRQHMSAPHAVYGYSG